MALVSSCKLCLLLLSVGVGSSLASKCCHDVDKSSVVLQPSLGSSRLFLFLLLLVNLNKSIKSTLPVHDNLYYCTHTQALCPGLPRWARTRKVKPIRILLKQETVSGSGIRWAICKSAPRSRQITMPAPHPLRFLQAGRPSCHPTNSVKALKATSTTCTIASNDIH